jgi:NACHT domain
MTNEDNRCLADLLLTDPRDDKTRIEQTKGGLLDDSFRWILDNPEFQQWRLNEQNQLLWIKGDPGKGKTMLMIGIINEMSRQGMGLEQSTGSEILSYFLCQGTDSRLNNATAVLRGLIYLLTIQQPLLISHMQQKYDHAGRNLFEDTSAFYSLSKIFQQMLQDPRLTAAYLAIDALDECDVGLPQLLDLITQTASVQSTCVKWIVSSRNRFDVEQRASGSD